MVEIILWILDVLAILLLLIGYLVFFVPILGGDDEKRNPLMAVASLILVYLMSLACGYFWDVVIVRVISAFLIGGLFIALIASFFSSKKSRFLIDFFALILFIAGSVYILYPSSYANLIIYLREVLFHKEISTDDIVTLVSLGVTAIVLAVTTTSFLNTKKRMNTLEYQLLRYFKQTDNVQTFNESYQKYLRDDIEEMIERLKSEVIEEVRITGNDSGLGPLFTPVDDISKLTREVKSLKKAIKKDIRKQEDFSVSDFVSDMKHSLMTPLSQILSNCELLEDELQSDTTKQELARIERTVKVCQSIINSYKEVSVVSRTKTFIGLREAFDACLDSAVKETGKSQVSLVYSENFLDNIEGYSNNLVIGMMAPLINNAVAASPDNASINITIEEIKTNYRLSITNICENNVPTMMQLNTTGYSSKLNHQGIGLSTVRNLIRLIKSAELQFAIEGKNVTVTINLEKRI